MSDELIRQMSSPVFYGLPPECPVRHVQTHISHVFLTGDYAYKVKKPVKLHFLDFSTLEKREHFCREELRLNRRFAPALYLGVVPIFEDGSKYSLNAPSRGAQPVEFALKMHEFDEDNLLTHWLSRGKLTEQHVHEIAQKMVRLHRAANTDAHVQSFGTPDAVERMIAENFNDVEPFVGRAIDRGQFDGIREAVMQAIRRDRKLIARRAREGRVRECHGDLHLRNMCWFNGEVQFFDCIEFNEEYRCIDVMYELAFLAMDLDYRERRDLSNALINEYLEQSGDYEGAVLLPTYMAVRAWIRSKVACLMLDDPELSPGEQTEARRSATAHFDYAERRMHPQPPALILVCGVSGTGKSTVATELAKRLDAIRLRSDAVRKHLCGVPLDEHRTDIYTPEFTAQTYAELAVRARDLLSAGWTVILDATFARAKHRAAARAVAEQAGVPFYVVHLSAPVHVLRERVLRRKLDVSDATPDLVEKQISSFQGFSAQEKPYVIEVSAADTVDVETVASRILGES